jgi:hypothetical protein
MASYMKMTSSLRKFMAVGLGLLLVSCSATRYESPGPADAHELSRFVLVIHGEPNGQAAHSWEPVSHFDLPHYSHLAAGSGVQGPIVHAAWTRNCEDELDSCVETCMKSLRGPNWSHANRGAKAAICRDRCRPAYQDCSQLRDQAGALKFPVIGAAVEWLKQHREELLIGTVVIIAGVAFVVVVVGSGGTALVLAPAILLVSADGSSAQPATMGMP